MKKEMNFGMGGGYNLPLNDFWKTENIKLERAFIFAQEEAKQNQGGN
jgi:hypothetical protein